jgi:PBP1b-binding outer membrane lipoprotein LpoB
MKTPIILLAVIFMACSSIRIEDVSLAKDFSLSKYKTFDFFQVEARGDGLGSEYKTNLGLLKNSITKQFMAKGITSTADNPDLMVNIGITITQEVQTRETSFSDPGDRVAYMGQRNYHWQSQEVVVGTYKQGSVMVDLVDRKTGELVWQGVAESVIPENEKKVPALIDEGMQKLFEQLK